MRSSMRRTRGITTGTCRDGRGRLLRERAEDDGAVGRETMPRVQDKVSVVHAEQLTVLFVERRRASPCPLSLVGRTPGEPSIIAGSPVNDTLVSLYRLHASHPGKRLPYTHTQPSRPYPYQPSSSSRAENSPPHALVTESPDHQPNSSSAPSPAPPPPPPSASLPPPATPAPLCPRPAQPTPGP